MPASISERILSAILADPLTKWFCLVIVVLFALGMLMHVSARSASGRKFSQAMPGTLISLGILGTFAGIFLGLLDFEVRKIDDSVPKLLEGMKFAFITSIIGMSSGISFKILTTVLPPRAVSAKSGATADDIHLALVELRKVGNETATATKDGFASLRSSIAGDSDGSLLTQIQRHRTDAADQAKLLGETVRTGFEKQLDEFRNFAKTMSENNAKALVEALKELIRDFNQKIHEQFGDNFKHLHQAVTQLLEWQAQYKTQIEAVVQAFEQARTGIDATRVSIADIAAKADAIPRTMTTLADILRGLHMQTEDLGRHLRAFEEIRTRAIDALPHIERNLMSITDGMRNSVDQTLQQMREFVSTQHQTLTELTRGTARSTEDAIRAVNENLANQQKTISASVTQLTSSAERSVGIHSEALKKHTETFAQLETGFSRLQESARNSIDRFSQGMQETVKALSDRLAKLIDDQGKAMQGKLSDSHRGFEQLLKQSGDKLATQFEQFDKQMQEEVARVIQTMGTRLAGLSNHFVKDYTPLTQELRKLIENLSRA